MATGAYAHGQLSAHRMELLKQQACALRCARQLNYMMTDADQQIDTASDAECALPFSNCT